MHPVTRAILAVGSRQRDRDGRSNGDARRKREPEPRGKPLVGHGIVAGRSIRRVHREVHDRERGRNLRPLVRPGRVAGLREVEAELEREAGRRGIACLHRAHVAVQVFGGRHGRCQRLPLRRGSHAKPHPQQHLGVTPHEVAHADLQGAEVRHLAQHVHVHTRGERRLDRGRAEPRGRVRRNHQRLFAAQDVQQQPEGRDAGRRVDPDRVGPVGDHTDHVVELRGGRDVAIDVGVR